VGFSARETPEDILLAPLGELKRSPYLLAAKRGNGRRRDRRETEGERIGGNE